VIATRFPAPRVEVLVVLCVVLSVAPGAAQIQSLGVSAGGTIAEPPPGSLGQVRFGSTVFTPSVGISHIGVDRNVFNEEGERKSDFTFTLGPQAQVFYGSERIRVRTTAGVSYVYYARYPSERAVNPVVRFEATYLLGRRITFFTDNAFAFTKDRPNAEVDKRTRRRGSEVLAGVRVGLGPRIGVQFDVRDSRTYYGHAEYLGVALEETLDREWRIDSLSLSYRLTPYTSVFTGVSLAHYRFPNTPDRDGTTRGVSAGLRFGERAKVAGEAVVGYSIYDAASMATKDHRGMTFNLRLSSALTDSLLVSFDGRQDLQFSYSKTDPYYLNHRYWLSLTQHLTRHLDVSAGTQQERLHYGNGTDRLQNYTFGPGVTLRGIRLGAFVGYSHRRAASGLNQTYEGFRYGMSATVPGLTVNDSGVFIR
jgi:hypothetical protein